MQGLMRLVCIGYLIFLTALLLVADPMRLVGVHGDAPAILRMLMPAVHFLSFTLLTVLALMTRWPAPRWSITLILMLYAGVTEIVQSFLPPRKAEWTDWVQDLAGIGAGAALCWIVAVAVGAVAGSTRELGGCDLPGTSEEWDVVRTVMLRPTSRSQSWWG